MTKKQVYDFEHYRDFLRHKTENNAQNWGIKRKLAEHIGCAPTYISQVLKEHSDLSLEQLFRLSDFFQLSKDEHQYLILIHQKDRAATAEVRNYYQTEMNLIIAKRLNLSKRLNRQNTLNEKDRAIYYSSWLYMAIHFSVGFNKCDDREAVKSLFTKVRVDKVDAILDFLISIGLLIEEKNRLKPGTEFIWLSNESPWIVKHHTNWRLKAIENLERETLQDLHFSSLCTISKADALRMKNIFLDVIKKNSEIIKESKEEKMYVVNIDFFDLFK
jgi:uncharacterized protein (TIGR02147 family)